MPRGMWWPYLGDVRFLMSEVPLYKNPLVEPRPVSVFLDWWGGISLIRNGPHKKQGVFEV